MYSVLVWNDASDDFIPERDTQGKRLSFPSWGEAAAYAAEHESLDGQRRRVEYHRPAMRRK